MPIFISGKVTMADGSPLPHGVIIKSICLNSQRTVASTDSKGYFNFDWNHVTSSLPDASDQFEPSGRQRNDPFGSSGGSGGFGNMNGGSGSSGSGGSMMGCELRAEAGGFRSDSLTLDNHRGFDNPDIGTIVLYRTAGIEGTSVSATSLNAPKDARKAYEKGTQALRKGKPADAQLALEKAVELYPKYANAWLELGRSRLAQKSLETAAQAFLNAVDADPKLVRAHAELGMMAARQSSWEEATKYLDIALKLDPLSFPQLWYPDAVAHFNLKNLDMAEKSVHSAIQHDPQNKNPQAHHLLGAILAQKNDLPGAAVALQAYMKLAPAASDISLVKNQLAEIQNAQSAKKQP